MLIGRVTIDDYPDVSLKAWWSQVPRDPQYDKPFHWWGPGWQNRRCPSMRDLLRDGTIDVRQAAVLWAVLARRMSVVVLAGPSGAGKTTLLTALMECLPPHTRRVYVRGCIETFAFASDPAVVPTSSVLLVNEISPHLPVYLWGPAVGRVLDEVARGFVVMATAHAESVPQFVGALTGSPLRIPAAKIATFAVAVMLAPADQNAPGPLVQDLWSLRATRDGVAMVSWQGQALHDISHEPMRMLPAPSGSWCSSSELIEREYQLEALRAGRIERLPVFRVLAP